ncbi:MAG: glycoside hydrolase family 43 protein [Janthinobacterium lividum]
MKRTIFLFALAVFSYVVKGQQKSIANPPGSGYKSAVWTADQGNGTYKNPILNADYSDPDAIRVGEDFYLISSSFEDIPGLPVLHSKDLVNWEIIGHALLRQPPLDHYNTPRHGEGVWAPSIRYYHNEFYIYYPDINYGIYLIKAKNPAGPWSEPILIYPGLGLEDPCPLLDSDGQMYLVHAFAGSKAGIKSVIVLNKLNNEGTKVINEGVIVYDGHETDRTIEGPKFYKRNSYYYIFAPAGGVSTGWQLVLRSKNVNGPYERKIVMDQGNTSTNGPHQGAWVNTQKGEDWFLHFQDKGVYGRVLHLEPMQWKNNWPVIGVDKDGDGKGEPVLSFRKPNVGKTYPINTPVESDEFNSSSLGLQWQWMANSSATWCYLNPSQGILRLYSAMALGPTPNLWSVPNLLLQKFPADEFMVTTKLTFKPNLNSENEKVGLTIMGFDYADIAIRSSKDGNDLIYGVCKDANKGGVEDEKRLIKLSSSTVYLRVNITAGAKCSFSYSLDGNNFISAGDEFQARVGQWIGAKAGIFCTRQNQTNDSGYADFDWFRVTPVIK